MNYIVLDLEWNQPVSRQKKVKHPIRLNGEIIQIGAVKVNENLEEIDSFNVIISPKYYTTMNKNVRELTGITNEDLAAGEPFAKAIESFRNWCGGDCIFLTWGPEDMYMLEDNLILHGMDYDWLPDDYDAQIIFDDMVTMEDRNFALSYAMFVLGVKPLRCHDALNDAINTVKVLQKLDMQESISEYIRDEAA